VLRFLNPGILTTRIAYLTSAAIMALLFTLSPVRYVLKKVLHAP
jgi:hypothetical protein